MPRFAPARVEVTTRDDGAFVLRSPLPLATPPRSYGDMLVHWATRTPGRTFLAARDASGAWAHLTYADALSAVRSIAQGLLDRDARPSRPVMLLSDNAIDHALVQLAAMHIGVPASPISPAYSLLSKDFAKLKDIGARLDPSVVYASDGQLFARAIDALDLRDTPLIVSQHPRAGASTIDALRSIAPTSAVDRAFGAIGPDTIAKVLFTSGSTGAPKGVVNTQRMITANQQAIQQLWPFLKERPPVVVDWLPWSHTFGGNHNFGMVLMNGGTLYIDGGKPAPGLIETTVRNLRDVSPTLYFNVPRGFDMLLPFLEEDAELCAKFFGDLDLVFYAAAALPQHLWDRIDRLSRRTRGDGSRVTMVAAWGSTETSPLVTSVHFPIPRAGVIGLPAPGSALAFVPHGDKLEMRVTGPNVTPGYWERGGTFTKASLDADGFLPTGDAGKLEDPSDPSKGVVFDGRIAENFKLSSGTWVSVGEVRVAVLAACAPLVQDAVVAGHDRDALALLVFPNAGAMASLGRDAFHAELRAKLAGYNEVRDASSTRIARAIVQDEPASIDGGEITDKGYINQRAVLERRAADVTRLYAGGDPDVIALDAIET